MNVDQDVLDPAAMLQAMVPAMALALSANFGSPQAFGQRCLALCRQGGACLAFRPNTGDLHLRAGAADAAGDEVALLSLAPSQGLSTIDWAQVYENYQHAVHAASTDCGALPAELGGALVIDVRRAGVYAQAATRIPGAAWRDPALVGQWAADLPPGRPIVVYCIYGHEVGRSTALRLRALGLPARYLAEGIAGWQAAGHPVESKEAAP